MQIHLKAINCMSSVRIVRHLARILFQEEGIIATHSSELEVVVGELTNNAVLHGKTEFDCTIKCHVHTGKVMITVVDYGCGFDQEMIPPPGEPRADGRIGGFGLVLVRENTNLCEIGYTDKNARTGTTVYVEKIVKFVK
jgi:anti-sigma regulatory factor (Ser/Thr protein kinase)